eukprot:2505975-Amphidinium_carterae.1
MGMTAESLPFELPSTRKEITDLVKSLRERWILDAAFFCTSQKHTPEEVQDQLIVDMSQDIDTRPWFMGSMPTATTSAQLWLNWRSSPMHQHE